MKQIYFIMTDTGTILSKIVKHFMKDEYGHVSISLDKGLKQMYSFGRINPYIAFWGGFVQEDTHKGTFRRFTNTKTKILELDIDEKQYLKLRNNIEKFKLNKNKYKFNVIGLFAIYFNKQVKRDNYFYCAEFVKHITENSNINLNLPELIRPENFKELDNSKIIYKGLLREYK